MKIGVFSIADLNLGKQNIKDTRLDKVDSLNKAQKKTYAQIELVGEESLLDADAILTIKESLVDLILKDLEFIETRLSRAEQENENALLNKLKINLEKEILVSGIGLNNEEKESISAYGLLTQKPIITIEKEDLGDLDSLLLKSSRMSGFISFFTGNERETRAWLIKEGTSAWEAAGIIHSDIQRGFIRAEVISFNDLIQSGGFSQAKEAGKMRLEQKEYIVQDADIINFRFNN
ncbi:MAG: DUF933 domain-containing protein [Candidatus Omnitrophica bacterium]|nr:DUF933 domain-containing protein [Candidatus Omnitrophota bacterium]